MPRFVILEHDHPTLHWDLMLERGAVLWTWRLPAPPPFEATRIPATRIGDHRLTYLDYEGPVGGKRGSVIRRERGTFVLQHEKEGELVIEFHGVKLSGTGTLTRINGDRWELEIEN